MCYPNSNPACSINYPKELVIVLDSSGSMKGFRQILAILTIRTIIETLSDQDWFTVIYFNDASYDLHPCFDGTLARATDQNKAQFKALLQNMETKGVAVFENAIEKSYRTFANFTKVLVIVEIYRGDTLLPRYKHHC